MYNLQYNFILLRYLKSVFVNIELFILIRFKFYFSIFLIATQKKFVMLLRRFDCRSGVRLAAKM